MTRKIHLRRNKNAEIKVVAACASNPYVGGNVTRNNRKTYQFMASEVVDWQTFKATDADRRCAHCIEAALVIRNRQRREKGLAPVADAFEGLGA